MKVRVKSIVFVAGVTLILIYVLSLLSIYSVGPGGKSFIDLDDQRYAHLPGGVIRYQLRSNATSASGSDPKQTVLLLHGFNGSLAAWDKVWPHLDDCGEVFRVDLPGFGKSRWDSLDYTIEKQAERIVAFMDEMNIGEATIVGTSMGGSLAGYLSAKYKERVDKAILFAPSAYPNALNVTGSFGALLKPGVVRNVTELLVSNDFYKTLFPESKIVQALSVTSTYGDPWVTAVAGSTTPTLIVWARGDNRARYQYAENTTGLFNDGHLLMLEKGVGHNIPKARGGLVANVICDSLRESNLQSIAVRYK